jgi:hypothetical protein
MFFIVCKGIDKATFSQFISEVRLHPRIIWIHPNAMDKNYRRTVQLYLKFIMCTSWIIWIWDIDIDNPIASCVLIVKGVWRCIYRSNYWFSITSILRDHIRSRG